MSTWFAEIKGTLAYQQRFGKIVATTQPYRITLACAQGFRLILAQEQRFRPTVALAQVFAGITWPELDLRLNQSDQGLDLAKRNSQRAHLERAPPEALRRR